jgi:hypothetical protein
MEKVLYKVFFPFKLVLNGRFELENNFYFRLIMGFESISELLKAMNMFFKVFRVFFSFFRSKYG